MKKSFASIILFCAFLINGYSEDLLKIDYIPSARLSAIGGAHSAMSEGFSSLFTNPASFRSEKGEFSLSEFTIGLKGPVFDIANIIISVINGAGMEGVIANPNVMTLLRSLYAGFDITGPIYFGYTGKGLGFGIFNSTDATVMTSSGGLVLDANVGEQVYLAGGYAFRIPFSEALASYLDLGIMLKAGVRGEMKIQKSILELITLFNSFDIMTQPFVFSAGIGVDVGLRYSLGDIFAFGLVAEDAFTPTLIRSFGSITDFVNGVQPATPDVNELIPFKLNGGFMFSPALGQLNRVISDIDIYLDYFDILDFLVSPELSRNPLLNISLGLECDLLEIFSIRAGFYEGLFAAGFGLDLSIFRLQASMFGSEKSSEPGLKPVYNLQIGFEFRL